MPAPQAAGAALRNGWRQLTSMRTALVLLFLLAVAAIPGSLLPQRRADAEEVTAYFEQHPELAPVLDRLGAFDVYGSPWFSAVYLLLFVSLVGCILPRTADHVRALRQPPVDAPRRLSRLPRHATASADTAPGETADGIRARLRARRWRAVVRRHDDGTATVSAEKGYWKETGNLLMHTAMVVVLVGVAVGTAYGWHGNTRMVADHRFCNVLQQYEEHGFGTRADASSLPEFCLTLTDFEADFSEGGIPTDFRAEAQVTEQGGQPRTVDFTVNSPLRLDGAGVYLLGHGYSPVLRYTDRYGEQQTVTVPFQQEDDGGTARGLATFPDANVDPEAPGERDASTQVAFEGVYLPTAPEEGPLVLGSVHPDERDPRLMLVPYRGDLGLDDGIPESAWARGEAQIAAGELEQVGEGEFLAVGESMELDDGTTVEFLGTEPYIAVSVRHDPGQSVVLAGAVVLLGGLVLSLTGHRRRVWFRVRAGEGDHARSLIDVGGLPRSDYPGFADEFDALAAAATGGRTGGAGQAAAEDEAAAEGREVPRTESEADPVRDPVRTGRST